MASKAERKRLDAAIEAFHKHYSSDDNWGTSRWQTSLFRALSNEKSHVAIANKFVDQSALDGCLKNHYAPSPMLSSTALSIWEATGSSNRSSTLQPAPLIPSVPQPQPDKLFSHYILDAASLIPVLLLQPQPTDSILDMCAAPGGKTIAIAQQLFSHPSFTSSLTCNEIDPARSQRLKKVLSQYLPPSLPIRTTRIDASVSAPPSASGAAYDKVLLDAPCSSERHVVHAYLKAEKGKRACPEMVGFKASKAGKRGIVKLQTALLLSALRAVKLGGRVVYSTCSIDRLENEGVVGAVLERVATGKEGFGVEVVDPTGVMGAVAEWSEECRFGRICLPDHKEGWGPIYFCVLEKTER